MPLTMIAALMEDALGFLKCSRRKQTWTSPTKKLDYDTDDTSKSTEPGDTTAGSSDGSDTDTFQQTRAPGQHGRPKAPVKAPPGLEMMAPPGLDAPPGSGGERVQLGLADCLQFPGSQSTRLNSQAKVFVPSFTTAAPEAPTGRNNSTQLRQSIRLLKESLEQWEAHHFSDQQNANDPVEGHDLLALREALGRLSPGDAATVKAFLDAKADQPAPFITNSLAQSMRATPAANTAFGAADPNLFQSFFPGFQPPPGYFPNDESFVKPAGRWAGAGHMQQGQHYVARPRGERSSRAAKGAPHGKPADDDSAESLSTHLRDLSMLDNARVLMVRKINHLGIDPTAALKAHFSKFGAIDRVMVSATRAKNANGTSSRLRPATVGFLVMDDAGAVDAALASGEQHSVEGVDIVVSRFASHSIDDKK